MKNKRNIPVKTEEPINPAEPVDETGYVTKTDFEKFMDRINSQFVSLNETITKTVKSVEAHSEKITPSEPIKSGEFGVAAPIEKVSEADFVKTAELEEFMNQNLLINVNKSSNKEDNPVVVPGVNGVNMPILRGVDTWVKRKYVESLARCRHTRMEQRIPDVANPDKFVMDQNTSLKDQFVVKKDPHKYGFDWLEAILREAA